MAFWLELLGAVALLLWGLRLVRTGVLRAYGPVLRKAARNTDGQILRPFLVGCLIAVGLQSSAATAMIVAGFSGQAIIGPVTAFIAILGADLGTALATLVVSQKLPLVSSILIAIGVFGFLSTDSPKWRSLSRAATGLGLILLSLAMIGEISAGLAAEPDFVRVLGVVSDFPVIMIVAGLGLSYLAHSSLAMVLFGASLALSGVIAPVAAIYFVLGANIGSGLLPLVANLNGRKAARLPVAANLLLRTVFALIAAAFLPWIVQMGWLERVPGIAPVLVAHVALNTCVGVVGMIVARPLLSLLDAVVKDDLADPDHVEPKHLDEALLDRPAEALAAAKREALVMAELAQRMVASTLPLFRDDVVQLHDEIETLEESLDRLFNAIKTYLAEVMQRPLNARETRKTMDLLAFVTNMEHIGDIVDRNLIGLSSKKIALHAKFSDQGLAEIERLHAAVGENFDLAIKVLLSDEAELARQLYDAKANIRKLERKSIATHIERLGTGVEESVETSELHLDLLRDLKRINSHLTSTAYPVLMASGEVPKTKWKRKNAS